MTLTSPKLAEIDEALVRWRKAWELQRNGQFLVVGSKDETAGCQGCVARIEKDDTVTLTVKLPPALGGERITLTGLKFGYGLNQLRQALAQQASRGVSKKQATELALKAEPERAAAWALAFVGPPNPNARVLPLLVSQKNIEGGAAITWRFMRQDDNTWRVSFSLDIPVAPVITDLKKGAIGVDINAGFLSVAETDRHGNILNACNYQVPEVGQSANQREATRGNVIKAIMARCVAARKPLVLEWLDFQKKKRDLKVRAPESRRKLSALAYRAIYEQFCARARDNGVEVVTIDPAYTSTQGWVRYADQRGWTARSGCGGRHCPAWSGVLGRSPSLRRATHSCGLSSG